MNVWFAKPSPEPELLHAAQPPNKNIAPARPKARQLFSARAALRRTVCTISALLVEHMANSKPLHHACPRGALKAGPSLARVFWFLVVIFLFIEVRFFSFFRH
jgi:hypothetical protein